MEGVLYIIVMPVYIDIFILQDTHGSEIKADVVEDSHGGGHTDTVEDLCHDLQYKDILWRDTREITENGWSFRHEVIL